MAFSVERLSRWTQRSGIALLLSGVALPLLSVVSPAMAQTRPAPQAFAIAAQPLDAALTAFGTASGVQVLFDASVVRGIGSPGVRGTFTPAEALSRLLAGTGFAPNFTSDRAVTLQRQLVQVAPPGSPTILPPVEITGRPRMTDTNGIGPMTGIVPTRSTSATKSAAPLIETPQSVSVVTRDAMTAQGARTVDAGTRYTSGIRSERFGTDTRHDWFAIRGIHATSDGGFLDGHSLFSTGYAGARIENFGLERIEVVKGPNSALYGGVPAGGFVNMISKRPQFTPGYEVQAGIDSFGQAYTAADATGAVDKDGKWAYRVTALGRGGEAEGDDVKDSRLFLAPSLTWRPNSETQLTILTSFQRDHTGPKLKPTFLPYVGTVEPIPGYGHIPRDFNFGESALDGYDRTQVMLGYELEHKVNDALTLKQNAKYTYLNVSYGLTYSMPNGGTSTNFARLWGLSEPESNLFSIDNSAVYKMSTGSVAHTLTGGLDFKYYRADNRDTFGFPNSLDLRNPVYGAGPGFSVFPPYNDNTQTMKHFGVYVQDEIAVDKWRLTLSGRHDWLTTDQESETKVDPNLSRSDRKFTGRAALLYKTDFGLSPYVSYSTFFAPTVGESITNNLFKPETGRQYEVGVKYQPEGSDTLITAAVFDIVRNNVISSNVGIYSGRQDDKLRSRGFEIEAQATPLEGLNLRGAFTAHNLKILEGSNQGKRPVSAPEIYASAWGDYTLQAGPLEGLGFGAGVRYVGNSPANDTNTRFVPSYTLADASVFYGIQGWRIALDANNLFDKRYTAACTGSSTNAEYCYFGEGRRVMLNASYKW